MRKVKVFWRTIALLLLFLVISQVLPIVGAFAFVIHDMSMGMTKEASKSISCVPTSLSA